MILGLSLNQAHVIISIYMAGHPIPIMIQYINGKINIGTAHWKVGVT